MEPNQRKRLNGWLRKQLYQSDTKVRKISIHHVDGKGQARSEIASFKLEEDPAPEALDDLVGEIEQAYTCDAEGLGDHQKYVILVHFSDDSTRRCVVSWSAPADEFSDPLDTEGASKGGILGQAMRHAEVFMKMTTLATGQTMSTQARTIQRLSEENERLSEKLLSHVQVMEDLSSQKHDRDLRTYESQTKQEMIRGLGTKVMNVLLPVVANRIGKGNLLKGKRTPTEEIMNNLVESLKPEQLTTLSAGLTADQQVLLFELITTIAGPPSNGVAADKD